MLMVSDLLRAASDPSAPAQLEQRSPDRYAEPERGVPVVVWNVVGHCNLSCPHCYASASKQPSPDDLTTEQGLALLDALADAGTKVVIFSGGEPMLRKDLFELIERATSLGLIPQLSSNGVFIDDEVARRLKDVGVKYVGISIDGMRDFNDRYRGLTGGFRRASDGLVASRRAGIKTGLRITLSKLNASELEPLIDHAATLGVERFYVSHLLYSGRAFRMGDDDLSPAESRSALDRLFSRAKLQLESGVGPDIVTGGNDSDGPALLAFIRQELGGDAATRVERLLLLRRGNSAGEKIINVDHLGRVHPDQFWQAATFGNVREDSLAQILAHPLRAQLRERTRHLTGRCGSCNYVEHCRGSHRERALAHSRDMWASDPACVMTDAEIGFVSQESHPA
ncbi:MAG: radical SAM protein [Myxococcales bacterium]|nr:radical SAM protein [Myxococcales bacterium]